MTFAWPWGLLALAALPALATVYWLRTRAARRPVSSLLLWRTEAPRPAAGRRLERLETPPLFWLEAAILLLLALAAAGPRLPGVEGRRPLVVVLDHSFSMTAGGADSPRVAVRRELEAERRDARHGEVTVVLAGGTPETLVAGVSPQAALGALEGWRPGAPEADLDAALAFAREAGGTRARILVLSDRAPAADLVAGAIEWRALGRRLANLAIVQAVRGGTDAGPGAAGEDAVLVELAAFADGPVAARLRLAAEGAAAREEPVTIVPGEPLRRRFPAPADAVVEVEVSTAALSDPLPLDDRVDLLPEARRPLRVALRIADAVLRAAVERALQASGRVRPGEDGPELFVTDDTAPSPAAAWTVRIDAGGEPSAFLGPFVVDRRHPLADGLSLGGVIWAAGTGPTDAARRPVVAAGEVPLVVEGEDGRGGREVVLRLVPALSTLTRSPDWPALWWNVVEWRAAAAPGPRRANLRLGDGVSFGLPAGSAGAVVAGPDGERRLPAIDGRVRLEPPAAGRYEVRAADLVWPLSVHPLAPAESDLRGAVSGHWGRWDDDAGALASWRLLGWLPGLLALGLLLVHLVWTAPRSS